MKIITIIIISVLLVSCGIFKKTTSIQYTNIGNIKVQMIKGQYTDSIGHYTPVLPKDTIWFKVGEPIIFEPNEVMVGRLK